MKAENTVLTVLTVLCFLLAGCAEMSAGAVGIGRNDATPLQTPSPIRTSTPTVGYQATAMAAQMTADASMRLQVEATSAQADRDQVNILLTAQVDQWTATAASTSIPLTTTAQVNADMALRAEQDLRRSEMTATAGAPTLMVAIANSKADAETARLRYVGQGVAFFTMSWMMFAIGVFVFLNWKTAKKAVAMPVKVSKVSEVSDVSSTQALKLASGTVITIRKEGGGVVEGWRYVVPCTEEMLTEFAEGIVSGEKTTGYRDWEGGGTLWKRDTYFEMRNFLLMNKFALSAGQGQPIVMNEDGMKFLMGWLDARSLPHRYEFEQDVDDMPVIIPHTQEIIAVSGGAGESFLTVNN